MMNIALDPAWAAVGVALGLAALSAVSLWVGRITKGQGAADAASVAAKVAADAAAAAATTAREAHQRLDDLNAKFGDFKEHVAREYVPNAAVTQMEQRMAAEFQHVRTTLEKLFVPATKV